MNAAPNDPILLERLAAEYVLGTLRGPARRRLERWRTQSALLDGYCRFWEERLMPLLQDLAPVAPPAHVWRGIEQRLRLRSAQPRAGWVRQLALAASVLLVIGLAALGLWRTLAPGRASEVATITSPQGLMWQIEIFGPGGAPERVSVRAGTSAHHPEGRDYELWALPKGGKPVSLGVLPDTEHSSHLKLTAQQQQALTASTQLAVSVEPPGGSPTGQPTGAVVFVAALRPVG
jgi:anti-sigma-K factor RskA